MLFYHRDPLSRLGGGAGGFSAGGRVLIAGCWRGAGGASDGAGDASAGGLTVSTGVPGFVDAGLSVTVGWAGCTG